MDNKGKILEFDNSRTINETLNEDDLKNLFYGLFKLAKEIYTEKAREELVNEIINLNDDIEMLKDENEKLKNLLKKS